MGVSYTCEITIYTADGVEERKGSMFLCFDMIYDKIYRYKGIDI